MTAPGAPSRPPVPALDAGCAYGVDPGCVIWRDRRPCPGAGLDLATLAPPSGRAWLHSARSAIRWLLAARVPSGGRVLLPAYGCAASAAAVAHAGARPCFYHVDPALRIDWPDLAARARALDARALLIVHYFGRLQDGAALAAFRSRFPDVLIVEDLSHTLLNQAGLQGLPAAADYGFASLRKLLPVPDGAVVLDYHGRGLPPVPVGPLPTPPSTLRRLAAAVCEDASLALRLCDAAERDLDRCAPFAAAHALTRLVAERLPVCRERLRRRAGWRTVSRALAGVPGVVPLWADLPRGCAPLGFVVRARDRHDLRQRLVRAGVHPIVHWPLPGEAVRAARRAERLLAGTLLTLPCDPGAGHAPGDLAGRIRSAVLCPSRTGHSGPGTSTAADGTARDPTG